VPDRSEHLAAFDQLANELHTAATTQAHALRAHRGTAAGEALDGALEHTLDRLALLYGRGTHENLDTTEMFETAIANEIALAHERAAAGLSTDHHAQALIDAARRGVRINVSGHLPQARPLRGAYVAPLRPELRAWLHQRHEPFIAWRDGIVVALPEEELARLRQAGDEVEVLFLDADEMLDLAARDRAAFEAELDRRLAAARAAPDHVGDSRERHLQRLLHRQSIVLRGLRDRLAGGHPGAHQAIQPIVARNRAALENALAGAAPTRAALADPLSAAIDHERRVQELAARWAAEPDEAGLHNRFAAVDEAGSRLDALQQHRR